MDEHDPLNEFGRLFHYFISKQIILDIILIWKGKRD